MLSESKAFVLYSSETAGEKLMVEKLPGDAWDFKRQFLSGLASSESRAGLMLWTEECDREGKDSDFSAGTQLAANSSIIYCASKKGVV